MKQIMIRPDLRTAGGELCEVVCGDRFVGQISLVYREGERLAGSVQLDREKLERCDRDVVLDAVNQYVESLIEALNVTDCDVMVSVGPFEYVIATEQNVGTIERIGLEAHDDDSLVPSRYELVLIGEQDDGTMEYHVYEGERTWIAEAHVRLDGTEASGEIIWRSHYPDREEIDAVADLLTSDFDEDEVETFFFDIKYGDESIESLELVNGRFAVSLIRDDGDILTFDIFRSAAGNRGNMPVAQATIDITNSEVVGYIDLHETCTEDEQEKIAAMLLKELDKERDYDSVHLSFMHDNEPVDEIRFETEPS